MRQASWIAFLLLAVGLLSYEAALDQQDAAVGGNEVAVSGPADLEAADGGFELPPRP